MTTTPPPSSLVLRGDDTTAHLDAGSGQVRWERDGRVARIPLAAVDQVRGAGGTVEVVLTTASADRPAVVYALHEADATTAAAFRNAVAARLPGRTPGEPPVDGQGLVSTVPTAVARAAERGPELLVMGVATVAVLAAVDVTVAVRRDSEFAVALPFFQVLAAVGAFMVAVVGRGLLESHRLTKRGITVVAELDHHTDTMKVYRYTDLTGRVHHYGDSVGGERLEISYDPHDPSRAAARLSPYVRAMMALTTLTGLCMAGGGVGFTCYQFARALTG
ncbi:DUF3592 domain-containing protein [Streptomyces hainanensis]|uniref:DUF3592 domain-containing protein n=1 Tax=Streptomyces hainanensis TaxID=402648 RepID=UPI001FB5D19B|nr:DUF3592 domain-containing protein [Streptomyces hainanensis]